VAWGGLGDLACAFSPGKAVCGLLKQGDYINANGIGQQKPLWGQAQPLTIELHQALLQQPVKPRCALQDSGFLGRKHHALAGAQSQPHALPPGGVATQRFLS
jgi:hypothetical protein